MTKQATAALEDTSAFSPTEANYSDTLGVLWGAQAIADYIERPVRDVYYLLQQDHIDADKCGDLWVTTKDRLRRQFNGEGRAKANEDRTAERDVKPSAAPSKSRKRVRELA